MPAGLFRFRTARFIQKAKRQAKYKMDKLLTGRKTNSSKAHQANMSVNSLSV